MCVIEDDGVVTSRSFYSNLKKAFALLPQVCPGCRGVSLFGPKSQLGHKLYVHVNANKAYGYTRQGFLDIVEHAEQFCTYGDYNWDVSADRLPSKTFGMLTLGVNQLHVLGKCGLHGPDFVEGSVCEDRTDVEALISKQDHSVLDESWEMPSVTNVREPGPLREGVGGWSDPRDFALCRAIASLR